MSPKMRRVALIRDSDLTAPNGLPNRVKVLWTSTLPHFHCEESIMEEFVADEVESILYIAREISGMPHALPYDAPVRERSSIQDSTFEGKRRSPGARVG